MASVYEHVDSVFRPVTLLGMPIDRVCSMTLLKGALQIIVTVMFDELKVHVERSTHNKFGAKSLECWGTTVRENGREPFLSPFLARRACSLRKRFSLSLVKLERKKKRKNLVNKLISQLQQLA